MKPFTMKARMMLLKLLVVLVCSELLATGQSPLRRASELVAKGSLKEAEVTLRQIIAADPNSVDARILLGTTLVLEGVRSESVEQLTEAVRLRPNSANAHNKLGMAFSRFLERPAAIRRGPVVGMVSRLPKSPYHPTPLMWVKLKPSMLACS
jgi:Flp pilus assembly protein TadD